MIKVYVAGPLTEGESWAHARKAILAGDRLFQAGFAPFIPHLNILWAMVVPESPPYQRWIDLAIVWLNECDVMVRLPGCSKGADIEEQFARKIGVPVVEWHPRFDNELASLRDSILETLKSNGEIDGDHGA